MRTIRHGTQRVPQPRQPPAKAHRASAQYPSTQQKEQTQQRNESARRSQKNVLHRVFHVFRRQLQLGNQQQSQQHEAGLRRYVQEAVHQVARQNRGWPRTAL